MSILGIVLTHVLDHFCSAESMAMQKMFYGSASLFFMTSGALIFPVGKPSVFIRRRVGSYLWLFVAWSILYAFLAVRFGDGSFILWKHEAFALFAPTFGSGWFIYALTGLYLFAPVLSPWLTTASRRNIEWFLAAWLLSGLIPLSQTHMVIAPQETFVAPFFGFTGFMVAGYYLARWPLATRSRRFRILFYIFTVAVGILFASRAFVTAWRWGFAATLDYDLSINGMAMCLLWFAVLQMFRSAPALLRRMVTAVSTASLGIYLSHVMWINYVFVPLGWGLWEVLAASMGASVLTGLATQRLQRLLRKKRGNIAGDAAA